MTRDTTIGRALDCGRETDTALASANHPVHVLLSGTDGTPQGGLAAEQIDSLAQRSLRDFPEVFVMSIVHAADAKSIGVSRSTTLVVDDLTTSRVKLYAKGCCTLIPMSIVGRRVKAAREAAGLSQAQLAQRVGVTQQTIDKIEREKTRHPRFVVEIADALSVSASYLKGISDDPTPEPLRSRIEAELKGVPDDRLTEILRAVREAKSS